MTAAVRRRGGGPCRCCASQAGGGRVFMSSVSGLITTAGYRRLQRVEVRHRVTRRRAAMELRPWRIPVSLVEPGPIRTECGATSLSSTTRPWSRRSTIGTRALRPPLTGTRSPSRSGAGLAVYPRKVVSAVEHALTAKHPKRRCYSMSPAVRVFAVTPTAVSDAVGRTDHLTRCRPARADAAARRRMASSSGVCAALRASAHGATWLRATWTATPRP